MIELWKRYVFSLNALEKERMLLILLEYMMNKDDPEIDFQMDDYVDRFGNEVPDDGSFEEFIYWKESGDNILS